MSSKRSSPGRRQKAKPSNSKSSLVKPRAVKRRASSSKILGHVGSEDGRAALLALAKRHPELVPEIEDIIREECARSTFEDVADQVVAAIAEITLLDLGRGNSAEPFYRSEIEMVWDLFSETLAPFVEVISRRARMGLVEAALAQGEGVLLGLYRAERDGVSELFDWIPDDVEELASETLEALAPIRRRRLNGKALTAGKAQKEFARDHLPGWSWL